ncbi:hypothetical protein VTL71DRAFT_12682 [Oculimacula yallundae]|uniref:Uracil permease n=1 Tax=Oculimacula yallundae TaxID=86028 RepID=A0ABR4CPH2_9HELO
MPPSLQDGKPDHKSSSRDLLSSNYQRRSRNWSPNEEESEPLLSGPSTPRKSRRLRTRNLDSSFESINDFTEHIVHHSSDESTFFDFMMEKVRGSKVAYWANRLAVESEPGLTNAQLMLCNDDLKPVEAERRQWGPWNFVGFWVADSFNINTWMISSSMISASGLSWWQSWICVWLGYAISGMFVCMTGRIGATYHISFPVVSRSSFGIWGALWPVFNRAAMACIWYGVQAWIGGNCIRLMISSIWPSFENIHNGIPGSGTNTRDFISFLLFWLLSLPAIWFPVHKIRHLFTLKAFVVPTAGIAFFIWAVVRAKGLGPIVKQPNTSHGSKLAWGMVTGIMSAISNFATLIVNDPDFARFARKPKDALWSQLLTIPCGFGITSFIGIIVSSSSTVIFEGEPIWNPLDLLKSFLDEGTSGNRAGVFFIASAFALAQLGTNIAANSVSAGTDMTALLPRYLNIRRGGYICAIVGLVMCPWNLLKDANKFTTYLSAYSVFLSSIAGVIVIDYYFVRKGFLQVKDLYSAKQTGPYYFTFGCHWRGYAAYIAGILINIVGFVGAIGVEVPKGAQYIYNLNFFCGFIVAGGVYYLLCKVFPVPATSDVWMEVGDQVDDMSFAYDAGSEYGDDHGGKPGMKSDAVVTASKRDFDA